MFKVVFAKLDLMTHEVVYFGTVSFLLEWCWAIPMTLWCGVSDVVGSKIYQSATIRYLVKGDDPERDVIEIPGFAVFFLQQKNGERPKLSRAETYLNPTEVFSRIAEKGLWIDWVEFCLGLSMQMHGWGRW
jgi:hypothetical protein